MLKCLEKEEAFPSPFIITDMEVKQVENNAVPESASSMYAPYTYILTCSGSAAIRSLNMRKTLSSSVSCFAIASSVSSSKD